MKFSKIHSSSASESFQFNSTKHGRIHLLSGIWLVLFASLAILFGPFKLFLVISISFPAICFCAFGILCWMIKKTVVTLSCAILSFLVKKSFKNLRKIKFIKMSLFLLIHLILLFAYERARNDLISIFIINNEIFKK